MEPIPVPELDQADGELRFSRVQQVGMCLAAAGLGYCDMVEMTTYHVGLREHLDVFVQVKNEFIVAPYPAWTAIGVSELITPGALVEIRVTAEKSG